MYIKQIFLVLMLYLLCLGTSAQSTETIYLSGRDADQTVKWDFFCSKGNNSGKWKKIAVPSCWEQQGFGEYTYGRYYKKKDGRVSDETGTYRHQFKVPAKWQGRIIKLTFDGVMTDAKVSVNGQQVGPVHQGGFTSFTYDITPYVSCGKTNRLEVFVKKQSDDKSVNLAERHADWWLFGGIYRPVYLQAFPKTHIEKVAVDARADGQMRMDLFAQGLAEGAKLKVSLSKVSSGTALSGQKSLATASQTLSLKAQDQQRLSLSFQGVEAWDVEHPHLYDMNLQLIATNGQVVHEYRQRVGFRTMEFRPRDGFYMNGKKLVVKGINRHCFYPETGRTTSKRLDIEDAKLVKGMNANAIRSHYPPDKHFLDICDSLGILYFDELPGWQNHYNTEIGTKILCEMMADDANHPSIFAWGNGNEGGFNYDLDPLFREYDIQQRHVVHPWALFNGVDAHHYPAYQTGVNRLHNGYEVFMPTEFLHSQYDKGGGASLDEYWAHWSKNPLFAGGFIWAMIDEGVVRTDRRGEIDTDGTNAPDGVLGPHREKEGSWFTIRDVWSPIQIAPLRIRSTWDGRILVKNESLFSRLDEYRIDYRILSDAQVISGGSVKLPAIGRGESGYATLVKKGNGNQEDALGLKTALEQGDVLELVALRHQGDTVNVWTYPLHYADEYFQKHIQVVKAELSETSADKTSSSQNSSASVPQNSSASVTGTTLCSANGVKAVFDAETGMMSHIYNKVKEIPFNQGPLPVGMKAKLQQISARREGNDALLVMHYTGAIDSIVWRMTADGWLGMDAVVLNNRNGKQFDGAFFDAKVRNLGFSFSYPEQQCKGMRWMGKGPYRVWRNRLRGPQWGIWQKSYNNTVTGESWEYPEFKGYHANVYWAEMQSDQAPFLFYTETDGLYYRVFTPEEPKALNGEKHTMQPFPEGDLSFLFEIPGIQSYKPIEQLGPEAQPGNVRINIGDDGLRMKLWFHF